MRDAQGNQLATYKKDYNGGSPTFTLAEQHLYASSRLGMIMPNLDLSNNAVYPAYPVSFIDVCGLKNYELSNHLSNVLTTTSDRKIAAQNVSDFSNSNYDGWSDNNGNRAVVSIVNNQLYANLITGSGTWPGLVKNYPTVPGKLYSFSCDIDEGNSLWHHIVIWNGSQRAVQIHVPGQDFPVSFVATGSSINVEVAVPNGPGYFTMDDAQLREIGATSTLYANDFNNGSIDSWAGANSGAASLNANRLQIYLPTADNAAVTRNFTVTPGKTYKLKYNLDLNGTNVIKTRVIENSAATVEYNAEFSGIHHNTFIAQSSTATVRFYYPGWGGMTAPYGFYVDDVTLEEVEGYSGDRYVADIKSTIGGYGPFGNQLTGLQFGANMKFTFNGKEQDVETGTQDYGMRIYNPSLGRFLSTDPLTKYFPWYTPYQFAGNKPIAFIDLDGAEEQQATTDEPTIMAAKEGFDAQVAVDGVGIVMMRLFEWCVTDNYEGGGLRKILIKQGYVVSDLVSDETLGENFQLTKEKGQSIVVPDEGAIGDLVSTFVGAINASVAFPSKGMGPSLMVASTSPLLKKAIADALSALKYSAILKKYQAMTDLATGQPFRKLEAEGAAIIENTLGFSMKAASKTGAGDFMFISGKYIGKSLDLLGMPLEKMKNFKMSEFKQSITDHFNKAVDFIGLDLRSFSKEQREEIMQYINQNHKDKIGKLITIE